MQLRAYTTFPQDILHAQKKAQERELRKSRHHNRLEKETAAQEHHDRKTLMQEAKVQLRERIKARSANNQRIVNERKCEEVC